MYFYNLQFSRGCGRCSIHGIRGVNVLRYEVKYWWTLKYILELIQYHKHHSYTKINLTSIYGFNRIFIYIPNLTSSKGWYTIFNKSIRINSKSIDNIWILIVLPISKPDYLEYSLQWTVNAEKYNVPRYKGKQCNVQTKQQSSVFTSCKIISLKCSNFTMSIIIWVSNIKLPYLP